jgi:hypothetical protein
LTSASKNTVNNNNTDHNVNKLKYTGYNNNEKNLKNQGSVPEIISLDSPDDDDSLNDTSDEPSKDISNDIPASHNVDDFRHNSLTYKPKFVLCYSPDLIKQEPISTNPAISHSNLNKPVHLDDSINHVRLYLLFILYIICYNIK